MKVNVFLNQQSEWLKGEGKFSHIVISIRIRLARNIAEFPFPHQATPQQREKILETLFSLKDKISYFKDALFFKMQDLSILDREFLIERHLISVDHAHQPDEKGVIISKNEVMSVMVNEEDHLRMQVLKSGFEFKRLWEFINDLDDRLSEHLNFAFSQDWGYLTACPTNIGTGLRASVMMHLPGLVLTKRINKLLSIISKLNFAIRGLFGEGTQAIGNFFQVSNQVSLGLSEIEIIENIEGLVKQIIEQEEEARNYLLEKQRYFIEDKIWRGYAVLKEARIISSQETLELLSMLRLGIDLGIIKNISKSLINEIFINIQPAHLQKYEGKVLNSQERDIKRASFIREKLKNV